MGYHTVMKTSEISSQAIVYMNVITIILSRRNQVQKHICQ